MAVASARFILKQTYNSDCMKDNSCKANDDDYARVFLGSGIALSNFPYFVMTAEVRYPDIREIGSQTGNTCAYNVVGA